MFPIISYGFILVLSFHLNRVQKFLIIHLGTLPIKVFLILESASIDIVAEQLLAISKQMFMFALPAFHVWCKDDAISFIKEKGMSSSRLYMCAFLLSTEGIPKGTSEPH